MMCFAGLRLTPATILFLMESSSTSQVTGVIKENMKE